MIDRNNTIAGWVLAAGIVALGSTILFGKAFHSEVPKEGKQGYAIQGVESAEGGAAAGPVIPLATLLSTGDVAKGEAQFAKCASCHTINAGGANGIGPNLNAVLGDHIGKGRGGYAFSDALGGHGGEWTWENMDAWLTNPKKFAAGTKMGFAGISNAQDRASLLLYLNTQGSNLPLPPPPAEGAAPAADAAVAPAAKDGAAAPATPPAK
jgi:cytochrome c